MDTVENTKSCKLKEEELTHLNKFWEGSFSNFTHAAFKTDIDKITNNKRQNRIQKFTQDIVMLGLGAIFILFSLNTTNLLAFLIVFCLGIFFMSNSLLTVGLGIWEKMKNGR